MHPRTGGSISSFGEEIGSAFEAIAKAMQHRDGSLADSTIGLANHVEKRNIILPVLRRPLSQNRRSPMARSKPSKQLSQAEIERFLVAAEALHKSIVKPFISPHCEHYRATRTLHEALLK